MPYDFTSATTASVDWVDADGNPQHADLAPGTVLHFDDPCSTLNFVNAFRQQTGGSVTRYTDDATQSALVQACGGGPTVDGVLGEDAAQPHPAPTPPPAVPADGTGDGEVTEDEATDPATTGAPSPAVDGNLFGEGRPAGESDGRTLEEQYIDADDPMTDAEIVENLQGDAATGESLEEGLERVQRGEPTPRLPHFDFGLNNAQRHIEVADPVDLFGGHYYLRVVDVSVPSRGPPIELVRVYRSGTPFFGPWGFNWDHCYNQYVRPLRDGHAAVWIGQLREEVYRLQPDGAFEPQIGVFRRLEHEAAALPNPETYRLHDRGGRTHIYQRPAGWPRADRLPLVAIEDAYGNRHDLTYSAEGHLTRLGDADGRFLTFHYGQCELLEEVRDHTGRVWRYMHDGDAAHLAAVIVPPTAASPTGRSYSYEYDILEHHARLRHNLIRVIDADDRTVVYNEYGKEPSSEDFGRVVTQYYGSARADFRATQLQDVPRIPSAINIPAYRVETLIEGIYRVSTFNMRGNLLDERYRLNRDGSYRLFARVFQYDDQGNQILRVESNGLALHSTYDFGNGDPCARGNLLQIFREAPPTSPIMGRRIAEMTYEPRYQQLRGIKDEAGNTTEFVYDYEENAGGSAGLVRIIYPEVTRSDGTKQTCEETCTLDSTGRLVQRTTTSGRIYAYTYYGAGASAGLLESVTVDPSGLALVELYQYDAWGNSAALIDPLGQAIRFTFDAVGRLMRMEFPADASPPPVNEYEYNASGQLARARVPRGEYADGVIAEDQIHHVYEHDALGRICKLVEGANTAAPRTRTYEYDAFDQVTREIDSHARRRERRYDERGLLIEESFGTPSLKRTWRYIFDRNGNQTILVPPSNRRVMYGYDPWDRPSHVVLPPVDGVSTEVRYRYGAGDVLERMETVGIPRPGATPATLFRTDIAYDELRRPVKGTRDGADAMLWWSCDGQLEAQEDFRGNRTTYAYDGAGRLTALRDAAGNETRYGYDAASRLTRIERHEVEPGGATTVSATTMRYDARGNLIGYSDPLGNSVTHRYDSRGMQVEIIDPLGQSITMKYGLGGELLERAASVGGNPVFLRWDHDAHGRVRTYVDPEGATTQYEYNFFDEIVEQRFPDGSRHRWTYSDSGDRVREDTPAGSAAEYTYDGRGDLSRTRFTAAAGVAVTPDITFERDGMGRVVRVIHGAITVTREYDQTGRLIADAVNGNRVEMAYDDVAGERRLRYPDGRVDRIVLDVLNRPIRIELQAGGALGLPTGVAVGGALARYEYAGFQRPVLRLSASGIRSTWRYDLAGRVLAVRHAREADDVELAGVRYLYDALGRRRVQAAGPPPLRSAWYRYDELSRLRRDVEGVALPDVSLASTQAEMDALVAAVGAAPVGSLRCDYDLDRADTRRRLDKSTAAGVETTVYATNTLRQHTTATTTDPTGATTIENFAFDADGRRTQDGYRRFTYDVLGRLLQVQDKVTGTILLAQEFDGLDRIVRRHLGATAVEDRMLFGNRAVQTNNGAAVVQRTFGLFDDDLVLEAGGSDRWSLLDDRFSLLVLCADSATVLERYRYDRFGTPSIWAPDGVTAVTPSAAIGAPVFGGHRLVLNRLYHPRDRSYDPATGTFLQRDREGYEDSPCLYAYAAQNPIDFIDPMGRWIESAWDVASLGLGVYSAYRDAQEGSWGWFALDCVGIVLDTAALILPIVPGGVGAAIKAYRLGNAAVDAGSNAWRTGRIVIGNSDDAARVGQMAYRAETVVRGGQAIDHTIGVGQGFYQAGSDFSEGNYLGGMLNLAVAGVGARGGMSKWYDMPTPARRPLNWRERPFYSGGDYPLYGSGPWRAFGNTAELLRNPRVQYRAGNLIHDDRTFGSISRQYWARNATRRANGMQLQHTWVMNSTDWVPRGFRNSGLNVIEVPGRLNSWMGDSLSRNGAFRLQVASYIGVTGMASFQTADEMMATFLEDPSLESDIK